MKSRFTVKIVETEYVTHLVSEYQRTADSGNPRDGGPVYEYVTLEKSNPYERVRLLQEVDKIDLPAVIKALNKL